MIKLEILTAVAGLLAFVAKFFFPNFPLDAQYILSILVAILGTIGVVPQARSLGRYGLQLGDLLRSMPFWTLVAGLIATLVHYYAPTFPVTESIIAGVIVWILSTQGINPTLYELQER